MAHRGAFLGERQPFLIIIRRFGTQTTVAPAIKALTIRSVPIGDTVDSAPSVSPMGTRSHLASPPT
jgi:hypothetical protein